MNAVSSQPIGSPATETPWHVSQRTGVGKPG